MPRPHRDPATVGQQDSPTAKISRRAFGRKAAGVAAISLSPTALLGHPPESSGKSLGTRSGGPASDATSNVDAKRANIIRKYGDRLSEEQRQRLRRILVYDEKMMDGIRAVHLENGDPPASVLRISFDTKTAAAKQQSALPPRMKSVHRHAGMDGEDR